MEFDKGKVGLPPGTPIHTGKRKAEKVSIRILDYDEDNFSLREDVGLEECIPRDDDLGMRWIHVMGVHDVDIVQTIAKNFGVDPLTTEDIVRTEQRPKLEAILSGIYMVVRHFQFNSKFSELQSEQISIILGEGHLVSFQETSVDLFEKIISRIERSVGIIRKSKGDYLSYALIDLVVDQYFYVFEILGEKIEALEDVLITKATTELLQEIYHLKRSLITMRRHIWPLREVVFKFNREEVSFVQESTQVYLRDLYDHVLRVTDHLETFRESLSGALDIYLSSMSNRMNEVMKVLTVISTIFIPLTLMASIYGMNWPWMPELEYQFGYPVFLIVMVIMTSSLLVYFRRIGWI